VITLKSKTKTANQNQFMSYWGKQAHYAAFVNAAAGIGLGLLLQPYLAERGTAGLVGWCLLLLGVLGHLYALVA